MNRYHLAFFLLIFFIQCKQSPDKQESSPKDSSLRPAAAPASPAKAYDYCYVNHKGVFVFNTGDPAGTRINLPGVRPRLSPDGAYLAFTYQVEPDYERRIGLMDLTTLKTSLVDSACHNCYGPVWSPDGKYLAYNAMVGLQWNIKFVDLRTGKASFIPLDTGKFGNFSPQWSGDSKKIIVQDMTHVYLIDLNGNTVRTININSIDSAVGVGSSANFLINGKEDKLICDCELSTDSMGLVGGPPPHLLAYDLDAKKLINLQPNGYICFDPVLKDDTIFSTGYRSKGKGRMNIYRIDLTGGNFRLAFRDCEDFSCRTR
jgi:hypothetical protein